MCIHTAPVAQRLENNNGPACLVAHATLQARRVVTGHTGFLVTDPLGLAII